MVAATDSRLPTLPGGFNYPAPTVPSTANAPYKQASRLPQDFVFITVGTFLALITFIILAWRIVMAWSINRSFRQPKNNVYTPLPLPLPDVKKSSAVHPSYSLNDLPVPRNFSQNTNASLFFSPTAEAAKYSLRPSNNHLPAGHYQNNSDSVANR